MKGTIYNKSKLYVWQMKVWRNKIRTYMSAGASNKIWKKNRCEFRWCNNIVTNNDHLGIRSSVFSSSHLISGAITPSEFWFEIRIEWKLFFSARRFAWIIILPQKENQMHSPRNGKFLVANAIDGVASYDWAFHTSGAAFYSFDTTCDKLTEIEWRKKKWSRIEHIDAAFVE